jgi:hypothetical protein
MPEAGLMHAWCTDERMGQNVNPLLQRKTIVDLNH